MLHPDFDSLQLQGTAISHPKIRTEYAGGFRKLSPKNQSHSPLIPNTSRQKTQESDVIDYISQIGVENLTYFYANSIPDNSDLLAEKERQQQKQSVVRLYRNLYPSRKSRVEEKTEDEDSGKENKKYASDVWQLDKKYQTMPMDFIVRKEMEKLDRKYKVELEGVLKKKKIEEGMKIQDIFPYFILGQNKNIIEVTKKSGIYKDLEMQVFYLWKGFLSTANFKTIHRKYQKEHISQQTLENLRRCSKYLFSLLKLPSKQEQQKNAPLGHKQLKQRINKQLKFQVPEIKTLFQIDKQYTNPYYIAPVETKKKTKKSQSISQPAEEEEVFIFKAGPVPKSTYEGPKERSKPEAKTTVQKPFKISQKGQMMTPEEYYHFQKQREFKAQPIPSTTYKPYKPELLSEEQKKARAILKLQQAQYPKTMQNLQTHNQLKHQKLQQLAQKHAKNHPKPQIKQIPNYDRLHAQQLILFQTLREANKKEIKVQPFHLSMGKKKPMEDLHHPGIPQIHPYSPSGKPVRLGKSTKKFEAYVHYRTEYEQNKLKKKEQQQKQKQRKQKKKQPYRQLIKARMAQELQSHPKKTSQYDPTMSMKIKVDKQKIYREKPLLMTSTLPKQQPQLPWNPIF